MDEKGMKTSTLFRFVYVIVLVFLYIAATTDIVIKEKTRQVYPVAFLAGEDFEEYGGNVKKGMDAASDEFNVDMSLLPTTKEMGAEEKINMLREEIELGAKAILVGKSEKEVIRSELERIAKDVPVITIGDEDGFENMNKVYVDDIEIANLLFENLKVTYEGETKILFLTSNEKDLEEESVIHSASESLKEAGFSCENENWKGEWSHEFEGKVLVAMNKRIATELAKVMEEDGLRERITGFYGIGSTTFLLNKLDSGLISGLIAWDDFALGYVAVESAMHLIKLPAGSKKERMDCFFLDKEILDSGQYMKVLYQIS